MNIQTFIRFFRFSRKEVYGIWILFVLICVVLLLPRFIDRWMPDRWGIDEAEMLEIERFLVWRENQNESYKENRTGARNRTTDHSLSGADDLTREKSKRTASAMRFFDPNTLDVAGWQQMGFSLKQAQVIRRYVENGGRFRKKEDLRKIYVIDEEAYQQMENYIVIGEDHDLVEIRDLVQHRKTNESVSKNRSSRPAFVVELNAADSLSLLSLPGIGPVFASRILRFRDRLGGFHSLSQIKDVYGMDSLRLAGILMHIRLDTSLIQRIRINEADQYMLGRHPLIGYRLGALIIRYREHHGAFRKPADFLKIVAINDSMARAMLPYFEF